MTLLSFRTGASEGAPVAEVAKELARVITAIDERLGVTANADVLAFKEMHVPLEAGTLNHLHLGPQERLSELVNQGATFVRMRDALDWVHAEAGPSARVRICHPSTTAGTGNDKEADLHIDVDADGGREEWLFEVSDVLSRHSNGKLLGDCKRLAAIAEGRQGVRAFLATSGEGAGWRSRLFDIALEKGDADARNYRVTAILALNLGGG